MSDKKWFHLFLTFGFSTVFLVFCFNFIVDPFGYNLLFSLSWNKVKQRQDVRIEKYLQIKGHPEWNAFILGSSRAMVLNPETFNRLANIKSYNLAFGAATIEEMYAFTRWLSENRSPNLLVIGLDLFNFADNFESQGRLPKELEREGIQSYEASPTEYLTQRMTQSSIKTIKYNIYPELQKTMGSSSILNESGMRIYSTYLECKSDPKCLDHYIKSHVTGDSQWHTKELSGRKLKYLREIVKISKQKNIRIKYFLHPIHISQIQQDNFKMFRIQLQFLKRLVNITGEIFDCNLLGEYNYNSNHFVDSFHFNYNVGNLILKDLFSTQSGHVCALVKEKNMEDHIREIEVRLTQE